MNFVPLLGSLHFIHNTSINGMDENLIQDKTFDQKNFTQNPLAKGEYENCSFIECNFSNADIEDIRFLECEFKNCNLSSAKLRGTAFRDIQFTGCKMLGLHFENCSQFGLSYSFDNCNLNHSSFYKTRIKKTIFKNTQLK